MLKHGTLAHTSLRRAMFYMRGYSTMRQERRARFYLEQARINGFIGASTKARALFQTKGLSLQSWEQKLNCAAWLFRPAPRPSFSCSDLHRDSLDEVSSSRGAVHSGSPGVCCLTASAETQPHFEQQQQR